MSISLSSMIVRMTYPNLIYVKSKDDLFDSEELDLYKMQLYKDYIHFPYINETELYDAFLDEFHLVKEKKMLHETDDFVVSFRKFIDNNKKYGHELYRYFYSFKESYLTPIAIEWCEKNKISYEYDVWKDTLKDKIKNVQKKCMVGNTEDE